MDRRTEGMLIEWAEDVVNNCHKSGFYGINIVEKLLRDPGRSKNKTRSYILWWPRNRRIAKMSRLMHRLDPIAQICLVVKHGRPIRDDGNLYTKHDLARDSSVGVRKFNKITREAENKLSQTSMT